MEPNIKFVFRQKNYSADYLVCQKEYPIHFYVTNNSTLSNELRDEVCFYNDGNNLQYGFRTRLNASPQGQVVWVQDFTNTHEPINSK